MGHAQAEARTDRHQTWRDGRGVSTWRYVVVYTVCVMHNIRSSCAKDSN